MIYNIRYIIQQKLKIVLNSVHDYITWVACSHDKSVIGLNCRSNCHSSRHAVQILMSMSKSASIYYQCRVHSKPEVDNCAFMIKQRLQWQTLKNHSLLPKALFLYSSFTVVIIAFVSAWSGTYQVDPNTHLLSWLPGSIMLNIIFWTRQTLNYCGSPCCSYL